MIYYYDSYSDINITYITQVLVFDEYIQLFILFIIFGKQF